MDTLIDDLLHRSNTYKQWRMLHPEILSESYARRLYYRIKQNWHYLKDIEDNSDNYEV